MSKSETKETAGDTATMEDAFGIKGVRFNGKKENWLTWKETADAYASLQGFGATFQNKWDVVSKEEYELGFKAKKDESATSAVELTALEKRQYVLNMRGYTFLLLSMPQDLKPLVIKHKGSAYDGWQALGTASGRRKWKRILASYWKNSMLANSRILKTPTAGLMRWRCSTTRFTLWMSNMPSRLKRYICSPSRSCLRRTTR